MKTFSQFIEEACNIIEAYELNEVSDFERIYKQFPDKSPTRRQRATAQRTRMGVVKGGNAGYTALSTGMKPSENSDQWGARSAASVRLADKLNRESGLGKYRNPTTAPTQRPSSPNTPSAQQPSTAPRPSSPKTVNVQMLANKGQRGDVTINKGYDAVQKGAPVKVSYTSAGKRVINPFGSMKSSDFK